MVEQEFSLSTIKEIRTTNLDIRQMNEIAIKNICTTSHLVERMEEACVQYLLNTSCIPMNAGDNSWKSENTMKIR